MKLYCITNTDRFLKKVAECEGNVYYLDRMGKRQDMKQLADKLLAASGVVNVSAFSSLEIQLDNTGDRLEMLEFLVQGNTL